MIEFLPSELHNKILYFCSYKDILLFKSISKFFHNNIIAEEIIYDMISTRENIVGNTDLYTNYYRGKSYDYSLKGTDVKFVVPLGEKIVLQMNCNLMGTYSPEYVIITLNNCYNFKIYEFNKEVGQEEPSPEIAEYDGNDYDIYVIQNVSSYTNLNDFKHFEFKKNFVGCGHYFNYDDYLTIKNIKHNILSLNGFKEF